jgi:Trk-type K+ transport system membrane component
VPNQQVRPAKFRWKRTPRPARVVAEAYTAVILLGGLLLTLPAARADGKMGGLLEAMFTSVSAISITGLSTVNVETYWSPFGHLLILIMVKLGGLGILAVATLIGVLFSRRIGMRSSSLSATESANLGFGDIKSTIRKIVLLSGSFEAIIAIFLTLRLLLGHNYDLGKAIWYGTFHSVASFNHAGFMLYGEGLNRFQDDPWIILPICFNVIVGSLGFFVVFEIGRRLAGRVEARRIGGTLESRIHWTLTSRIVLWATLLLLSAGTVFYLLIEWDNPGTLGDMSVGSKILNAFGLAVFARSGGFNTFDIGLLDPASMLGTDILMFIGGGSGSTAGGIKLTTAAVLVFIVWTEIRGDTAVNIGSRRLPRSIQRQALTLISLAFVLVISAVVFLQVVTEFSTDKIIFEVISAFGTVGLSSGILPEMPAIGQLVLMALMFIGRLGTVVIASSLAARVTHVHFEYPKERPLIG